MKKVLATIAMLAIPGMAMAVGLVGDCYDCHTMHNSEAGQPVAQIGSATGPTVTGAPAESLLKLDCIACHANDPTGGSAIWTMPGGSQVPQVAHGGATDLAGGNFSNGIGAGNDTASKVHNVLELFAAGSEHYTPTYGNPPGMYGDGGTHTDIFTSTGGSAYDQFSCAGARGCHGTRNQIANGTGVSRVGMAAISGAHHLNYEGLKDATNYAAGAGHSGAKVAEGFRFIPGLKGTGNTVDRWQNIDETSHNEYYGAVGTDLAALSCAACHVGSVVQAETTTMAVPNNSMSGFCSTCHGKFHSSGSFNGATDMITSDPTEGGADNGISGAFLRHPSDYVIPNEREYAAYQVYDVSAPVARQDLTAIADTTAVVPGSDMVMCLSCHQAHGSANDYILRFDYTTMTAGSYATQQDAQNAGGCLACHTLKGVIQ